MITFLYDGLNGCPSSLYHFIISQVQQDYAICSSFVFLYILREEDSLSVVHACKHMQYCVMSYVEVDYIGKIMVKKADIKDSFSSGVREGNSRRECYQQATTWSCSAALFPRPTQGPTMQFIPKYQIKETKTHIFNRIAMDIDRQYHYRRSLV